MKRVTYWLVSPSKRMSNQLSARTGEQAVQFMQGLKRICPDMPNDLCICTNEVATHFVTNGCVWDSGKFYE